MILYGNEAREHLKKGVDMLADAVKVTLGPCGNNVVIDREGRLPLITKDGVTVAKHVHDDKYKTGINLIRSVAEKMGKEVGDSTTSSTVLTQEIVNLVFDKLRMNPKLKPVYIKRGIDKAAKQISNKIKQYSIPVEDKLKQVALISSNGDEEIANIVTEVVNTVGKNGLVSIKPSESNTYVKYSSGLKLDTYYMSPNFVTDPVKMEVEYEHCHIYIYDKKLEKLGTILPALDWCKRQDVPVIIMVKDIDQDILNTLVYNKIDGRLRCCVVKIPGHEQYRADNIADINAVIGRSNIVDKVLITSQAMYIENNQNNEETKETRINSLKHRLTLEDPNVEDLTNRIANISNSFATIYVSGNSEVEIQEKTDRYDDSLCAIKSALEEGIVRGGGNTLNHIKHMLTREEIKDESELVGYNCMIDSLSSITKQILKNGDIEFEYKAASDIIYLDNEFKYVNDSFSYDIIDSTKGCRLTVENAASIAGAIITTNCVII